MSTLLAVFTCHGCSSALLRHWPYFLRQEADYHKIITTTSPCYVPDGVPIMQIGGDAYIDGPHLPIRMLDTIEKMLDQSWMHLILAEYDTVFFKPIPVEKVRTVAGYHAGGKTWDSQANAFYHNPWVFHRDFAEVFLAAGRSAIERGVCPDRGRGVPSTPECSPDVFFGYVCEWANIPVHQPLWKQYSRNDLNVTEHLEEARAAYRDGCDVIHGIKTKEQLEYITA